MGYKILFLSFFLSSSFFSQKSFDIDLSVVSPCNVNAISTLNQKVYFSPNPSNGQIWVNSEEFKETKIFSLSGSLLLSEKINSSSNLYDISYLSKGMYFIVLVGENKIWKSKLIVE